MQTQNLELVIPLEDIRAVELARLKLYELLKESLKDPIFSYKLQDVTKDIWEVTHKRYMTTEGTPRPD